MELDRHSSVVMITSAGCNALDYLLDDPARIHAIDVNFRQNALLELKQTLIASDMLKIARRKTAGVKLIQQSYEAPLTGDFDLVLFSYALTMFNPGWEKAIQAAKADLSPGGLLAIVDFSHTGSVMFRRWMGINHVRMEGYLWPVSRAAFEPMVDEIRAAYAGIWHYGIFIGSKL
jgi:S-adenosylmethionine-diacylgycerolhomoserine-N-methlytransferase